jgi:hypothetical protein
MAGARLIILLASIWTLAGCSSFGFAKRVSNGATVDFGDKEFSQYIAKQYCRFQEIRAVLNGERQAEDLMVDDETFAKLQQNEAPNDVVKPKPDSTTKQNLQCRAPKRETPILDTEIELAQLLGTGYAYVDAKCEAYFDALHQFYKRKSEDVTNSNIVTGALSGILAAIQASAKSIALVAVGGTATTAGFQNYRSSILFDLDPAATQSLVLKAQKGFQEQIALSNVTNSFPQTLGAIGEYARLCMPPRIEKLVAEAVRSAEPSDLNQTETKTKTKAIDEVRAALNFPRRLTEEEGLFLYGLLVATPADDATTIDLIRTKLSKDLQAKLFGSDGKLRNEASEVDAARILLRNVDEDFMQRSKELVDSLAPSPPPADTAPPPAASPAPPAASPPAPPAAASPAPQPAAPAAPTDGAGQSPNSDALAKDKMVAKEISDEMSIGASRKIAVTIIKLAPLSVLLSEDYPKLTPQEQARIKDAIGSDVTGELFANGELNNDKKQKLNALLAKDKQRSDDRRKSYLRQLKDIVRSAVQRQRQNVIKPLPNMGVR